MRARRHRRRRQRRLHRRAPAGTPLRLPLRSAWASSTRGCSYEGTRRHSRRRGQHPTHATGEQRRSAAAGCRRCQPGTSGAPIIEVTIPIGRTLGPVTIHEVAVRFGAGLRRTTPDPGHDVDRSEIGLLQRAARPASIVRVDKLGVALRRRLRQAAGRRNLASSTSTSACRLPRGVAARGRRPSFVTGGGFLFHDEVQQLYAGVARPDPPRRHHPQGGRSGRDARCRTAARASRCCVFITAEDFQPIPIGLGFTLRGIGGMLAINRTFDEDAMRAALRQRHARNVLFPKDPIHNVTEIITQPARRSSRPDAAASCSARW